MSDIHYTVDFRSLTGKLRYMGYQLKSVSNDTDLRTLLYTDVIYPIASEFAPEDTGAFIESPINPGGIYEVEGRKNTYRISTGYIKVTGKTDQGLHFGSYEQGPKGIKYYNEYKRSGIPAWSKNLNFRMNRDDVKNRVAETAIPYIVKELNGR